MKDELDGLLGQYWDLAFAEGLDGASRGTEANEVLTKIRAIFRANAAQEPVCIVTVGEMFTGLDCLPGELAKRLPKGKHNLYTTPPSSAVQDGFQRVPLSLLDGLNDRITALETESAVLVEALEKISRAGITIDSGWWSDIATDALAQHRIQK